MDDRPAFTAPVTPQLSSGSPQLSAGSLPPQSPFHGDGPSWKRNLLVGALVVVVAGGGVSYFSRTQKMDQQSEYLSNYETTAQVETEVETDVETDFYYGAAEESSTEYSVEPSSIAGYMTFSDYANGYRIDYPESWEVEAAEYRSFASPYESGDDYLMENLNIGLEDVSYLPSITFEEYADAALGHLVTDPGYIYLERGPQAFGSYEGMYMLGQYDIGGGEYAGVRSLFTIQDGMVYILTYLYELPEKEMYVDWVSHMVASFELIDVVPAGLVEEPAVLDEDLGFASLLHLP